MRGFFELDPIAKPKANRKRYGCESCGLYKEVKSPRMPYTGEGKLGVYILSEAPGRTEDEQNKQLVGDVGNLLRDCLDEQGYDLDRDFWKNNAIRCRPTDNRGENRTPTSDELKACEPHWRKEITLLKPSHIMLFGAKAIEAYFMYRSHPITKDLSMGRWVKQCIPDSQTNAWVLCLYHPSFAVRTPDFKPRFKKDLKWGLEQLKRKPPKFEDWKSKVHLLTRFDDTMQFLETVLRRNTPIAIDYETSGLRPYRNGHHVWSVAICLLTKQLLSYSFPYSYPGHWNAGQFATIQGKLRDVLASKDIPKVAQSIQMEDSWSRRVIGASVDSWLHDTMICSHVINEHKVFTGLDFQVFINWGFEYGENITPYKSGDETGFNQMHKVPLKQLLEYNGLDSLFTGILYQKQKELINNL